jgi:hypothetical protein
MKRNISKGAALKPRDKDKFKFSGLIP